MGLDFMDIDRLSNNSTPLLDAETLTPQMGYPDRSGAMSWESVFPHSAKKHPSLIELLGEDAPPPLNLAECRSKAEVVDQIPPGYSPNCAFALLFSSGTLSV